MNLLLLILVVLLILAVLPTWPYSRQWGYAPSGTIAVILVILLLVWLL
ncbi:MAG TPA: DUF3309 family protein [Candidatus Sulfomarinibacteraceae bacterium]|nr:DUF3309 family protein [Methylomirabilota bacterium]HSN56327.1 DUF3309 family protein [Candidatus Sulfomarinibacteraceae bacterium]